MGDPGSMATLDHFARWKDTVVAWQRAAIAEAGLVKWDIRWDGVSDAIDYLGLTWPIDISQVSEAHQGVGAYNAGFVNMDDIFGEPTKVVDRVHVISIAAQLSPAAASMSLWHELTHAKQAEGYPSPWAWWEALAPTYSVVEIGSRAYFEHPLEAEAFNNMDFHYIIGPLTR